MSANHWSITDINETTFVQTTEVHDLAHGRHYVTTTYRDDLMHAARVLRAAEIRTKAGTGKPRQRWASPGSVAIMQDCVRLARVHNITAMMFRKQEQEA